MAKVFAFALVTALLALAQAACEQDYFDANCTETFGSAICGGTCVTTQTSETATWLAFTIARF
jgi:hypothetical protein